MVSEYVEQVKRKLDVTLEDFKNSNWISERKLTERIGEAMQAIHILEGAIVQKDERIRQLEKERDYARDMYSRARYPDMMGS